MKGKKNFTLYWMTGVSAALTVPIAIIIFKKVQAGNVGKTVMIVSVFLVLLLAIMFLYKTIFGVTVQEITQEAKVTELDRLNYTLEEYQKNYRNARLNQCIDMVNKQVDRFNRRKNVLFQVADMDENEVDASALGELVETVEDALIINVERIVNRVKIFDDEGLPDNIKQHISYIEEQIHKINDVLTEYETLITETSRMGEINEDTDISKLRDVVNAMKSLRTDQENEIEELASKYEEEGL
ncbi:hypothetical protein I5677_08540 [Mobilitalea sibirica]|uniref:5-bromo-4-chloroindolyl phosphate hydrolysis protein n=1 Tax=Mobilitalea sibirica TaxID=1462919 RepID=A0A8J7H745_9FIRM|nr:hypothetical protein [Mobilitalea sibirica]MBH1940936.1 hypothetical protein [Mobilitalea sibirica]